MNFGFGEKPTSGKSTGSGSTRISSISISECIRDKLDHSPGWPLLRRTASEAAGAVGRRDISVVQWAMSLPDRSQYVSATPRNVSAKSEFGRIHQNYSSAEDEILKEMDLLLNQKSSNFVRFDFEVLQRSTSHFSSGPNIPTILST